MRASEVYEKLSIEVEEWQGRRDLCERTRLNIDQTIEEKQSQMRKIMQMVIESGDRDLDGPELMDLSLRA